MNFIKSRVFDHSSCQDILQNTLLIIFNKREEYNSSKNFYNWSFSICRFQIKAYLSKKKRSKEFSPSSCSGFKNFSDDSDFLDSLHFHENIFPFQNILLEDRLLERTDKLKSIRENLSNVEKEFLSYSLNGLNKDQVKFKMNINSNYYNSLKSRTISKCKDLINKLNTENAIQKKIK